MRSKSKFEATFLNYWRMLAGDLPQPEREYRFSPPRRFRFDLAWIAKSVAVELEGGTWIRGSHVRGKRYASDCEKYNLAALDGWTVLRFTTDMLARDPAGCIEQVRAALDSEEETLPFTDVIGELGSPLCREEEE